ncbi:protein mono-ADP-ribosyltransferase TIPARP-like [Mustelus asterias]
MADSCPEFAHSCALDGGRGMGPLASEIEESYKLEQKRFRFAWDGTEFVINWVDLSESDLTNGVYRKICRRPVFCSPLEMVPYLRTLPSADLPREPLHHTASPGGDAAAPGVELPASWVAYPQSQGVGWVPLALADSEYQMVYWMFHQTISESKFIIAHIYRIQNAALWEKYAKCRAQFYQRLWEECPSGCWDRHLFHGTSAEWASSIGRHNFDPGLSGRNGCLYGRGSYFATRARYSHEFALPARPRHLSPRRAPLLHMFLAKVLTGRSALGSRNTPGPPSLAPAQPAGGRFDSCVNSLDRPTIYVLFDSAQCYPYWLIQYQAVDSIVIE